MKLKLEKQKNKIHLTIKNRTQLWTRDFVMALSFALALHVLALSIFHIDLHAFFSPLSVPRILRVSTDFSTLSIESELKSDPPQFPAFFVLQSLKSPPFSLGSIELSHHAEQLAIKIAPLTLAGLDLSDGFEMTIPEYHLSHGHTFKENPPTLTAKKQVKAKLEFKADGYLGSIFWLDWQEKTGDSKLDNQIIENLKNSKISPSATSLASHGIIEIDFKN